MEFNLSRGVFLPYLPFFFWQSLPEMLFYFPLLLQQQGCIIDGLAKLSELNIKPFLPWLRPEFITF